MLTWIDVFVDTPKHKVAMLITKCKIRAEDVAQCRVLALHEQAFPLPVKDDLTDID
jgi:hypothetical protein